MKRSQHLFRWNVASRKCHKSVKWRAIDTVENKKLSTINPIHEIIKWNHAVQKPEQIDWREFSDTLTAKCWSNRYFWTVPGFTNLWNDQIVGLLNWNGVWCQINSERIWRICLERFLPFKRMILWEVYQIRHSQTYSETVTAPQNEHTFLSRQLVVVMRKVLR